MIVRTVLIVCGCERPRNLANDYLSRQNALQIVFIWEIQIALKAWQVLDILPTLDIVSVDAYCDDDADRRLGS